MKDENKNHTISTVSRKNLYLAMLATAYKKSDSAYDRGFNRAIITDGYIIGNDTHVLYAHHDAVYNNYELRNNPVIIPVDTKVLSFLRPKKKTDCPTCIIDRTEITRNDKTFIQIKLSLDTENQVHFIVYNSKDNSNFCRGVESLESLITTGDTPHIGIFGCKLLNKVTDIACKFHEGTGYDHLFEILRDSTDTSTYLTPAMVELDKDTRLIFMPMRKA